jgi:hypothetical protein
MYMFSVSSTLIALGFVSQVSEGGEVFQLFALTVLPTLFFLGVFTFVRLVQSSVEDVRYGRAINRIRLGVTLDLPLAVAAVAGIAFLAVSVALHMRYDRRNHARSAAGVEALFPSS